MRVTIRDPEVLGAIQPTSMATYLRTNQWRQVEQVGTRGAIWVTTRDSGSYEVLLPTDRSLRDYALRMAEVIRTLELIEQRSQVEIVDDASRTMVDTIRIIAKDAPAGLVSIDAGAQMAVGARDLLLAAACATVEKRTVFATRKPAPAIDYIRGVQQTAPERGSFVITLLSPVAPALQTPVLPELDDPPFERKVTMTLAEALNSTSLAAVAASASGDAKPFFDGVPLGVHANLCDALASLLMLDVGEIVIRLSWSPSRPVHRPTPERISFSAETRPILEEASRAFRASAPPAPLELEGHVVKLESMDPAGGGGTVTIASLVDGSLRKVRMSLGAEAYLRAVEAHGAGTLVRCLGNLAKEKRGYVLQDVHALDVADDGS